MSEINLNFGDFIDDLDSLGSDEWVRIYFRHELSGEESGYYCALVTDLILEKVMSHPDWDLTIDSSMPGLIEDVNKEERYRYQRFYNENMEPLVYCRKFPGKKNYVEISEEFRFYFNLYEDKRSGKFIYTDDYGNDEDVIFLCNEKVEIKMKFLKEFLYVKKMSLVLFFEVRRWSEKTLKELSLDDIYKVSSEKNYTYRVGTMDHNYKNNSKSFSMICGKKLIRRAHQMPARLTMKKKYLDFIIGTDPEGEPVLFTCNPSKLADYFGKNVEAPNYVKPIYFKKDVLKRYYDEPSKYAIQDGVLRCHSFWYLKIDNNHSDFVVVMLGDLGGLSYSEQQHWSRYNVNAGSGFSEVAVSRWFYAGFSGPTDISLRFKERFITFSKSWEEKYGWQLFKDLRPEDKHHFSSLHVPTIMEQVEFDKQILSLTKILIDSLNDAELSKHIDNPGGVKSVGKLELFLKKENCEFSSIVDFLKKLYDFRSAGVAHRKGDKYEKLKEVFSLDENGYAITIENILIDCMTVFDVFERSLIADEKINNSNVNLVSIKKNQKESKEG